MTALAHYVLSFLVGAGAGLLGGIFGISGGSLAIAAMAFLGHTQQVAQGTSLVMQLPNLSLGAWQYARRGSFDARAAFVLAVGAIPFSYLGALTATHVRSAELRIAFAVFLMLIATFSLTSALRVRKQRAALPLLWPYLAALGAFAGFLTGLFGIGGPAVVIPTLVLFFGVTQTMAQGLGLLVAAPGVVVGLFTYARAHDVDWGAGIALALGGVALVGRGVAVAHRLPERVLRFLFAAFIYTIATLLIVRAR